MKNSTSPDIASYRVPVTHSPVPRAPVPRCSSRSPGRIASDPIQHPGARAAKGRACGGRPRRGSRLFLVLAMAFLAFIVMQSVAAAQMNPLLSGALKKHHEGRLNEAIRLYSEVIASNPQSAEAYNWRGMAKDDLGKLHEALLDYNKAVQIARDYADAYNNRGEIYRQQKKYKKAMADYTKASALEEKFAEAHYNLGLVFQLQGEYDLAAEEYAYYLKYNEVAGDREKVEKKIERCKKLAMSGGEEPKPKAKKKTGKASVKAGSKAKGKAPTRTAEKASKKPGARKTKVGRDRKERRGKDGRKLAGKPQRERAKDKRARKQGKPRFKAGFKQPKKTEAADLTLDSLQKMVMDIAAGKSIKDLPGGPTPARIKQMEEFQPIAAAASALSFLFFAAMLFLIARKSNTDMAWMAFIPILQLYLMLKISNRTALWLILLLIPILGWLVFTIMVSFGMARARRKSAIWGVLLLLPVLNIPAMIYLALSR